MANSVWRYSSAAVPTTLAVALGSVTAGTTGSVVVNSKTGWPVTFPFTTVCEPNTASAEVITMTQAATGTGPFTFSNCIRGDDGTGAPAHGSGATIVHGVAGRDIYQPAGGCVNVMQYPFLAAGDGVTDDTAAIQAAINAAGKSQCYLPPGTYLTSSPLTPAVQGRIYGAGYQVTTITNSTSDVFNMQPGSLLDANEIDHLTITSGTGGGHCFTGANMARCYIHDCQFTQNNAAKGVWNAPGLTAMVECRFERNRDNVHGATRTVEGWLLTCAISNINNNTWRDIVCFNDDNDNTQYLYRIAHTGSGGLRSNCFDNFAFEFPAGGMIRIESCTGTVISRCFAWDLASLTVGNALISIGKNGSATNSSIATSVRDCGRGGGANMGSFADVLLESTVSQTTIANQHLVGGGAALKIDVGLSATAALINCGVAPANPATDTLTIGQGAFTVGTTPITVP